MAKDTTSDIKYHTIVRRLTPIEGMRLQGFEEGHLDAIKGDAGKFKAIGNSWAVSCARRVIKGIHKARAWKHGKDIPLRYGTISSGVEAHTMASRGLGDTAVFFSEIDPTPCKVLADKYPSVPNLGDMTLVDYDAEKRVIHNRPYLGYQPPSREAMGFTPYKTEGVVEIPCEPGGVDLVSGGTPCQSVSIAGKRAGMAEDSGTRSSLAFQLPRIGNAIGSEFIMWENVGGALSSNDGRDLLWFLHRCNEAGYTVAWRVFDAQFVRSDTHPRGCPQRRRRIFAIGYRGKDWRVPCVALFEPMSALGTVPPAITVGKGWLKKNPDFDASEVCQTASIAQQFDLFGETSAPKRQGEGLSDADLALDLPTAEEIRDVSLFDLNRFAKTVSKKVCYIGDLFQKWKWEEQDVVAPDTEGNETHRTVRIKVAADGEEPAAIAEGVLNQGIGNQGIMSDGFVVTMKAPEWNAGLTTEDLAGMPTELAELYDGDICGLTDILLDDSEVDSKYLLSWKSSYGILLRCAKCGKKLPEELANAIRDRLLELALVIRHDALENKKDDIREHAKKCLATYVISRTGKDGVNTVDELLAMTEDDIEKAILASNLDGVGHLPRHNEGSDDESENEASIIDEDSDGVNGALDQLLEGDSDNETEV